MPKMRTLPEAVRHIKATDPGTALTPHALRILVLSGKFPHVKIGVKRLVDIDLLEKFLSGECTPPPQAESKAIGVIRQLPKKLEMCYGS